MKGQKKIEGIISTMTLSFFLLSAVLCPIAKANEKEGGLSKQDTPIQTNWPAGAWFLETIGAVIAAAGFTVLGLGYSEIAQRDQYYSDSKNGYKVKARTIREYEDRGISLTTAGWATAGVGVAAMAIGAIWFLFHSTTPPPKLHLPSKRVKNKDIINLE